MSDSKKQLKLLSQEPSVISLGLPLFYEAFRSQKMDARQVEWKPPCGGDPELISILSSLSTEEVEAANREAASRLVESRPVLVDIAPAGQVIPGMDGRTILHAGPPIQWKDMCGPMKGAVLGALMYEGLAETQAEAELLVESGEIRLDSCHHHQTVGPMAGVVSSSMYVFVVENQTFGNRGFCTLNEGLGKVLRFGANDASVIRRLKWMEHVLAPALKKAVLLSGGIDVKNLIAQALMMGDECHNRNVAGTLQFLKTITPWLLKAGVPREELEEIFDFISGNAHFFLNVSMAACKSAADSIRGIENCTIVYCMARNGVEMGIRVSGLGDRWFNAPAGRPKGLYFSGFGDEDANPDLGDSTITEVAGIGAVAMASAPAIVKFVGGTAEMALQSTLKMYEITYARHRDYTIPALDFMGTPVGFDLRKIMETSITPIINTGIAHKNAGIGQVGAGILDAPSEGFYSALRAFGSLNGK